MDLEKIRAFLEKEHPEYVWLFDMYSYAEDYDACYDLAVELGLDIEE